YLLLLLSDGNLPTGSFVSSSGLESYFKHGFPAITPSIVSETTISPIPSNISITIGFIKESLAAYSKLALPFATDAHELIQSLPRQSESQVITKLHELDRLFESMTLNHVSRRASKAQGVALLTLFSKGFSRPLWTGSLNGLLPNTEQESSRGSSDNSKFEALVDKLKLSIRKGNTPGHLPICWGVLTGCLLLSKYRSQQLFLFLYARSLLSAAIRLNTIGPYASQQLLLHVIKDMVNEESASCSHLTTGISNTKRNQDLNPDGSEYWERLENEQFPATTWPLGEILSARHDLQHSRIFNS
ncbi:hypothetical protein CPB86DRAFT_669193, partial [Serendipita vermifera]